MNFKGIQTFSSYQGNSGTQRYFLKGFGGDHENIRSEILGLFHASYPYGEDKL